MTERAKRVQSEWAAQNTDAAFLRVALPVDAYWTAIDGGRATGRTIGAMRKRRGIKAGIPDFLIVWRGITLWIERKVRGRSVSDDQVITHKMLRENGHIIAVAYHTEDVERALLDAGIPLRATLSDIAPRIDAAAERKAARPKRATKASPRYVMGKRATTAARRAGVLL